jgi:hypothetical protein
MSRVNNTTTSLLRVELIDCFKYAQRFLCSFVQRVGWVKNGKTRRRRRKPAATEKLQAHHNYRHTQYTRLLYFKANKTKHQSSPPR